LETREHKSETQVILMGTATPHDQKVQHPISRGGVSVHHHRETPGHRHVWHYAGQRVGGGCSPDQLLSQEQERLLVVVVALGGNLVVLQVLLPARQS